MEIEKPRRRRFRFRLRTLLVMVTLLSVVTALFWAPTEYEIRHDTTSWTHRIQTAVGNPISIWSYDNRGDRTTCIVKDAAVLNVALGPDSIDSIVIRVNAYQKFKLSLYRNKFWIDNAWTRGNVVWSPETR